VTTVLVTGTGKTREMKKYPNSSLTFGPRAVTRTGDVPGWLDGIWAHGGSTCYQSSKRAGFFDRYWDSELRFCVPKGGLGYTTGGEEGRPYRLADDRGRFDQEALIAQTLGMQPRALVMVIFCLITRVRIEIARILVGPACPQSIINGDTLGAHTDSQNHPPNTHLGTLMLSREDSQLGLALIGLGRIVGGLIL
jgi:hypothetical protein